jgi:hypothetical protein
VCILFSLYYQQPNVLVSCYREMIFYFILWSECFCLFNYGMLCFAFFSFFFFSCCFVLKNRFSLLLM